MRRVALLLPLLLCSCVVDASGPAVESVCGPPTPGQCTEVKVAHDTMSIVFELVARRAEPVTLEFDVPQAFWAARMHGNVSYSALGSACGDAAIVVSLASGNDWIAQWDIRGDTHEPMLLPVYAEWPNGLLIKDKVRVAVFDDMCQPTNFRAALTLVRWR